MVDSESEREHQIRTESENNEWLIELRDRLKKYPDKPKDIGAGPHHLGLKAAVLDSLNQRRIEAETVRNPIIIAICRHKGQQTKEQEDLARRLQVNPIRTARNFSEMILSNQIIIRPTSYLPTELIHLFVKFDQPVYFRVEVKKSVWFDTSRDINPMGTPVHD